MEAGEHGGHKQTLSLFLGAAGNQEQDRGAAVGLDYEYKFTPRWGLGGFAEALGGDLRDVAGGVTGSYHPIEPLAIVVGPELEKDGGHWHALLRIGALYKFEIGKNWILALGAYYDISESHDTVILGVNIGVGF